jgi:hypothetical protein
MRWRDRADCGLFLPRRVANHQKFFLAMRRIFRSLFIMGHVCASYAVKVIGIRASDITVSNTFGWVVADCGRTSWVTHYDKNTKAPHMTTDQEQMFDQAVLQELRDIIKSVRERSRLKPVTERYDLKYTMNRLAELVCNDLDPREADKPPITEIENIDELVAKLIVPGPSKRQYHKKEQSIGKRRPRADFERDVALALAVIYHEYTGVKPTRISKNYETTTETFARDKTSPFYRFATASFNAFGLKPRELAFRKAIERWERSRDFHKRSFQLLLWGRLPKSGIAGQPDLRWHEKKLPRRSIRQPIGASSAKNQD